METSNSITTTDTITATTIGELIANVWKNDIVLPKAQAQQFLAEPTTLCKEGIVVTEENGDVKFSRHNTKKSTSEGHKYIMPNFANQVRSLVKSALDGKGSRNICLVGGAGTGKTEFVHELAREFGLKVFQVNGSEGLTGTDFYGSMSVGIDESTKQNYTYFEKGPLYRAFIEGTQLDKDGNQVLDSDGNPIVVGKPAVFFLDEFASMLPEVFLGVFNRVLEIPRNPLKGRSMEVTMDNGRIVKSHPSMVIFLAGNTVGTGNGGKFQMGYTAQGNKMDESTRNRISGFYQFGYSKQAELATATAILNDDCEADKILRFRDDMRSHFRQQKIETLFTTRSIVATCELAKTFRENGMQDWIVQAIKVAIFNGLPEQDKPAFNEEIRMLWGKDLMAKESQDTDYDYI